MNKICCSFLLLILLFFFACSGEGGLEKNAAPTPSQLLLEIADERRFLSSDEVADRIINQDPSIQLVDVRNPAEFKNFALPGAINIPLSNILSEGQKMDCEKFTYVFYSNDDIYAEQAWILGRRRACPGCYVLKGGLNKWVETIMRPVEPPATASSEEWDLYQTRIGASRYFAGGSREMNPEPFYRPAPKPAPKKVVKLTPKKVEKKKEEPEEEEGC